jgi:hypothetical protein
MYHMQELLFLSDLVDEGGLEAAEEPKAGRY